MVDPLKSSSHQELLRKSLESDVRERDNPSPLNNTVSKLVWEMEVRHRMCAKYKLNNGGYDVLVKIAFRWYLEQKGSTAYSLAKLPKAHSTTALVKVVNGLFAKGLIEVLGSGKLAGSKVYIPSVLAVNDLLGISTVEYSATA